MLENNSNEKAIYLSIACYLISKGADLLLKNNQQQTPLDVCSDSSLNSLMINYFNEHIK